MASSTLSSGVPKLPKPTISAAVTALLNHKSATAASSEKLQLLPSDDFIYLTLTLTKIPPKPRTNPFKIPLPHPLHDPSSQICLILDDRPNSPSPNSSDLKTLIKTLEIPISKVLKISKLKTDYKPFESKRKLCDSYDLFLVDKRVVHLLPKLLGKEFFRKKKLPLGVDLGKGNLKEQVERVLGCGLLFIGSGTCCVVKVGKVSMERDEVVENVVKVVEGVVEVVDGGWSGVRSLHLKFCDSVALPIYQVMPDVRLKAEEEEKDAVGNVSDDGEVKKVSDKKGGKKKKGRIHEVRYMDVGEDESENIDEVAGVEDIDDDVDVKDEGLSVSGKKGKKRSKSKAAKEEVLGVSNEEKRVKKKAKSEKNESEVVVVANEEKKGKKKSKTEKNEGVKKIEALVEEVPVVSNEDKKVKGKAKVKKNESEKKIEALVEEVPVVSNEDKKVKRKTKVKKNESEGLVEEVLELKNEEKKSKRKVKSAVVEEVLPTKNEEKKSKRKLKSENSESKSVEEEVLGASNEEKSVKKKAKLDKNESGKLEKDESSKKGKRKSEVAEKPVEKIAKSKKKASAK